MPKVALIKKNRCAFDRIEEFVVPLLHKPISSDSDSAEISKLDTDLNAYIWSQLEPFVTFIDVDLGSGSGSGSDIHTKSSESSESSGLSVMDTICRNICGCFPDR